MRVETFVALHWNPLHPGRRRVGRGRRSGGKRRWDAPLQRVLADARYIEHMQDLAEVKVKWLELEHCFDFNVTLQERPQSVPPGPHQIWPMKEK